MIFPESLLAKVRIEGLELSVTGRNLLVMDTR